MSDTMVERFRIFQHSKAYGLLMEYLELCRPVFDIFFYHGTLVAAKALKAAEKVSSQQPDLQFIYEASMVHDFGILMTYAPEIDCFGKAHYIEHGVLGAAVFETRGLPRFARVCATHIGTGLTREDIRFASLPIPEKDYLPETVEEKIICWADKFYSKNINRLFEEKTVDHIIKNLEKHHSSKVALFLHWNREFGEG